MKKGIEKSHKATKFTKSSEVKSNWFVVDAKDKILGRMATQIAVLIRGKNNPKFTPNADTGDFVVVINADKVKVTGNKLKKKNYYRHSGYVGNLKVTSLEKMMEKSPEFVLRNAVKGMLPHNTLGRMMLRKLKIYVGEKHPHEAQKPEKIEI